MALAPILWNFEKRKFIQMGGSGSGFTINADELEANGTTEGDYINDTDSNYGRSIIVYNKNIVQDILNYESEDISFGLQSIVVRVKSTLAETDADIILARSYYVYENISRLLSTTYIKANQFDKANEYKEFGFITNFKGEYKDGKKLRVLVQSIADSGADITLDYINISPAMPGVTALPTVLS